jgi:hypothetical protein
VSLNITLFGTVTCISPFNHSVGIQKIGARAGKTLAATTGNHVGVEYRNAEFPSAEQTSAFYKQQYLCPRLRTYQVREGEEKNNEKQQNIIRPFLFHPGLCGLYADGQG